MSTSKYDKDGKLDGIILMGPFSSGKSYYHFALEVDSTDEHTAIEKIRMLVQYHGIVNV